MLVELSTDKSFNLYSQNPGESRPQRDRPELVALPSRLIKYHIPLIACIGSLVGGLSTLGGGGEGGGEGGKVPF